MTPEWPERVACSTINSSAPNTNKIDGGRASRQHRFEKCGQSKRLADEKTNETEKRKARREQADPRIVAVLPRYELMDGDRSVAA